MGSSTGILGRMSFRVEGGIADLRLQILDCRSWIADLGLQILDCRSWIADLGLQILDCGS